MHFIRTKIIHVFIASIVFLIPAIINGFPFLFFDSVEYLIVGDSIVSKLIGVPKVYNVTQVRESTKSAPNAAAPVSGNDQHMSLTYTGGRLYYSLYAFVTEKLVSFWGIAVIQSLPAAWLLWIIVRVTAPRSPLRDYYAIVVVLTAASALPFYVAFAMPDVFAGYGLLAIGLLLLAGDRVALWERIVLVVLSAASMTAHLTNTLLVMLFVFILAILQFWRRSFQTRSLAFGVAWVAAPLALVLALGMIETVTTKAFVGASPRTLPFLMGRVLADGSGRLYLNDVCHPKPRFAACAFENRKFKTMEDFLFSSDPNTVAYNGANFATRMRLKDEERTFVLGAILRYPAIQLRASLRHWFDQLRSFGLSQQFTLARRSWEETASVAIVPEAEMAYKRALAYRGLFPFEALDWIQVTTVLAALGFLAYRLTQGDVLSAARRRGPAASSDDQITVALTASTLALVIVLVANAAICGILSEVSDRYQARLIWLLPASALLVAFRLGAKPRNSTRA